MVVEGGWRAEEAIAGNGAALQALRELIIYPFLSAAESRKLGLKWPRGLLLHGTPGTGKTSLVHAVIRECGAHLTAINPHSVHRPHAGECERLLREAFEGAYSLASSGRPSVIFIDAICPKRDHRREQESRVVGQLLTLMDGSKNSGKPFPHIVVVGSTNRLDGIDSALRRPGRFDSEIEVTVPSADDSYSLE